MSSTFKLTENTNVTVELLKYADTQRYIHKPYLHNHININKMLKINVQCRTGMPSAKRMRGSGVRLSAGSICFLSVAFYF